MAWPHCHPSSACGVFFPPLFHSFFLPLFPLCLPSDPSTSSLYTGFSPEGEEERREIDRGWPLTLLPPRTRRAQRAGAESRLMTYTNNELLNPADHSPIPQPAPLPASCKPGLLFSESVEEWSRAMFGLKTPHFYLPGKSIFIQLFIFSVDSSVLVFLCLSNCIKLWAGHMAAESESHFHSIILSRHN